MRGMLCLLLCLLSAPVPAESVRLTIGEWPPYMGEQLPHLGVASRIISEAFAHEGIRVRWDFYPWARALHLAEGGKRTGSAVWRRTEAREQQFYISDPVMETSYIFFHLKDKPFDWQHLDDLRELRIGAVLSYVYGPAFELAEREQRLKVYRTTSDEQGFRLLLAKRIDIFPVDQEVALSLLHQQFSATERAQLSFHPQAMSRDPLHLLLSRKVPGNAELMLRFNRGLAQLRASGKLEQYLREALQPLSLSP